MSGLKEKEKKLMWIDNMVHVAYRMCSGKSSALPNTHATLTATLIIQTSMPDIVLVPPASTTPSSTVFKSLSTATSTSARFSSSASSLLTTRIQTLSMTTSGISNTSIIRTSSTPSTSCTSDNYSSVPVASDISNSEPALTKNQIAGITIASIGGFAIAIGLLIFFICCRRRRKTRLRESDLIPFQLEPNRSVEHGRLMDMKKHKYKSFKGPIERKPGGTRSGIAARLAPRIPPRLDTSSSNMFSRRSIQPDTIGLAISPERGLSVENQQRRSSKLLPEKPSLTLKVSPQVNEPSDRQSFNKLINQHSSIGRQSTATQFEEDSDDGVDAAVGAHNSWNRKSTNQILNARSGNRQTIRLVEPDPAPIALTWRPDQKPNDATANPDYYIRPLNIGPKKVRSFSQPRVPNALNPSQDLQHLSVPENALPTATSSSLYSTHGSEMSADHGGSSNIPSSRPNRFSCKPIGPYDQQEIASPKEPQSTGAELALSPVVESPASGRSPVSYPKIPPPGGGPRRLSRSTIRLVPPPAQPDFTTVLGAGRPRRQAEIASQVGRETMARQQNPTQGQNGMQGLIARSGKIHQPTGPRELGQPAEPSPVVFAFPQPPPPALVPGRLQTTPPLAMPLPYLFRTASQKLVSPTLLPSRLQLQRDTRTPPLQSQARQSKITTESPSQKPSPLSRPRSQLQREGQATSPSQIQHQLQIQSPQHRYHIQQADLNASTTTSPPNLIRSHIGPSSLPPLETNLQPQPEPPNDPVTVPSSSSTSTSSYPLILSHQRPLPPIPQSQSTTMRPGLNPLTSNPNLATPRTSSRLSAASSTTSSLLQKRLGPQKASALTLAASEEDRQKQAAKWRVLKREEVETAKQSIWRPMMGRSGERDVDEEGDGWEFERTELPVTPGWVPKLTPTRRGDELFLNVQ